MTYEELDALLQEATTRNERLNTEIERLRGELAASNAAITTALDSDSATAVLKQRITELKDLLTRCRPAVSIWRSLQRLGGDNETRYDPAAALLEEVDKVIGDDKYVDCGEEN